MSARPRHRGPILSAYRTVTAAAAPLAPFLLGFRERRGKEHPDRRDERLGRASAPRPRGPLVWFHAASVGETNAIMPLIAAVQDRRPELSLLLTTGTVTSARLVQARLSDGVTHQFLPLDVPSFVDEFLQHWRPDLCVFTESEIWPNLVLGVGERGIPLLLVNARLSNRSYRRWHNRPQFGSALFAQFDLVLAQNEETAARFEELGAPNAVAVGNLKWDAPPPPADPAELAALQRVIGGRPVFLAASTHPGEYDPLIEALRAMRTRHPELLAIVVPRHPERASAAAELFAQANLTTRCRTTENAPDPSCDVFIADTMGELGLFYALAPISFIGGSLVPHGGQNPVEAIKHRSVVLTGPNYHNFEDAYRALLDARGCIEIGTPAELATAASDLLEDEAARDLMLRRAERAVESQGGALSRTLDALDTYLPPPAARRRAS